MLLSLTGPDAATRRWTLALTSIAAFMVSLDSLIVITALPAIQRDLHSTMATLEWTINAYSLAFAAGIITAAALGDRLGRRRIFTVGLRLFTLASAACALVPTPELLVVARLVQGIGAAMIFPLSLTILSAAFPSERRGSSIGIWAGIAGIAVAGGPLVGGALTQGLDWHWIFWVNVPIGILASFFAPRRLAETFGAPTRLDLPAVGLVTAAAVSLVYGLVRSGDVGLTSPEVVIELVAGIVLLAVFVAWEARAVDPMLPLRLFRSPAFGAATAASFVQSAAVFAGAFLIAQFFQFVNGEGPFAAGLSILPWTGALVIVAPIAGAISDRVGLRRVMVLGLVLQGVGFVWLSAVSAVGVGYERLVVGLLVSGVGVSLAVPTTATAVMSAVPAPDMGKAAGLKNMLDRCGAAFGIALVSAIFAANGHLGSPVSYQAGFVPAMATAGLLSLAAAAVSLGVVGSSTAPASVVEQGSHEIVV